MDSDQPFVLLPFNPEATDDAGAWAELCRRIGVPPGDEHHADVVAERLTASIDEADVPLLTATTFRRISESLGVFGIVMAHAVAIMPAAVLERILRQMGLRERKAYIEAVIPIFEPPSMLALAVAATASYDRKLSRTLVQLLTKLRVAAETAEKEGAARADQAFRSLMRHFAEIWAAAEAGAADQENDAASVAERAQTRISVESIRVLQIALETGAIGPAVWNALVEQLRTEAGAAEVFQLLQRAPPDTPATREITERLATPGRINALLQEDPVDFAAVDTLVERLGMDALAPLLEGLIQARQRSTRRWLLDRIAQLGPAIAPLVLEYIRDERWFVVRNMVALLREAHCSLDNVPLAALRVHADPRVRVELLHLLVDIPNRRADALRDALQDSDRQVMRAALQAARTELPDELVPMLAQRVLTAEYPAEFRVLTLYLLGRSTNPAALETLMAFAVGGRTLLGRPKLAPVSPEMLAALGGLARSWRESDRAATVLEIARRTGDSQILNALHASGAQDQL